METTAIFVLLGTFFGLIALGCHISYSMIAASIVTFFVLDIAPYTVISSLASGISSFTFLAIPFFIFSGEIMSHGGISNRLIKLADACVGWMRGGLAMVNIFASVLFGAISGSAAADTASLGSILIPMMEKQGYDKEFSTAVTMSSSVEGMLIPPSHNMIIYAMAAGGLSVSALFMAGIGPGLLLALVLMVYSYYLAVKRKYPKGTKFSIKYLVKTLFESIWGAGTIIIVVGGVVSGFFTATESAAIACIYSILVSTLIYKEMKFRDILPVMKKSIKVLSTILLLIAASGPFGFCISYLSIPEMIVNGLLAITSNKFMLLLIINLMILLLGTILGMASIIVIVTPILVPVLQAIDVSLVQFGVILILNCGIGLITPPVGGVLFIGSGVSGVPIEKLVKHTLPMLGFMVIVLALVTYVPSISLGIPKLMGLI